MKNYFTAAIISIFLISSLSAQVSVNKVIAKNDINYLSNTLVIKLKSSPVNSAGKALNIAPAVTEKLKPFGILSSAGFLPVSTKYPSTLNNIIVVKYSANADPKYVAAKLRELPDVEWAEPRFVRKYDYVPNDPSKSSQYALEIIKAYSAWNLSKGDSAVIIGIVDTGVDWDHPDLAANIWVNADEIPDNGVDDDHNGYIDDVRGWDFGGLNGTPDNNPMEDNPYHGTHVAGIAAAVTDNSTGIASIGFNSTIMPVKVAREDLKNSSGDPYIVYGNEGIVYAADNGARIINCSFGGSGYSLLDQEIINYATSHNALVVASAGNEAVLSPNYPASYTGVLSVAATDRSDKVTSFSNYGVNVDVSAPGEGIYSTWQNNTYTNLSGTSMSSPLAAGLAALVAAAFPSYSAAQVAEQVRINCDDINSKNPGYTNLLGKGRINAFNALTNTNSIAVRAVKFDYSDAAPGGNGNGVMETGETISIGIRFVNYLNPVSGVTVTLETASPYVLVQNGSFTSGAAGTLDSFDNYAARYSVTLSPTIPTDYEILFTLNYSDGSSYTDFQLFNPVVNPTYATQSGNNIALTITSTGNLGFKDYPENLQGNGFHFLDGNNLLFEGGLILAQSASKIPNAVRSSNQDVQDKDFSKGAPFTLAIPGARADQQGHATFSDDAAGDSKIGITADLQSYTYNSDADHNYIILRYTLTNTSGSDINGLYTGLFFDWDLAGGDGDVTSYDAAGQLGYVYHPGGDPDTYLGTALISSDNDGFWAILNDDTENFQIYDGFTNNEKWQAVSNGVGKPDAGPGDISHVVSGGPFSIPSGGSIDAAFAIAAGGNIEDIRNSVNAARSKYQFILPVEENYAVPAEYSLSQNYPNPFNPSTTITYSVKATGMTTLKIYDILGNEVALLVNEVKQPGTYTALFNSPLASGMYIYELRSGSYKASRKMIMLK